MLLTRFLPVVLVALGALAAGCTAAPPVDDVTGEPEVPAPASPEIQTGIVALDDVNEATDDEALIAFSDIAADARFVGLGESVHTVGTYYAAKSRLFRYLVENEGFRVFAFETPWLDSEPLRAFVADGCPGPERLLVDTLAGSVFGVWLAEETLAGFRFMCAWNREHPDDRVGFYGFDAQTPYVEGPALRTALADAALDPAVLEAITAGVDRCNGATLTATEYFGTFPPAFDAADHAACLAALNDIDQLVAERDDATELALLNAALRASELQMWHLEFSVTGGEPDVERSFEARDAFMARATVELADLHFPAARVVVWAHNTHLAKRHDESVAGYYAGIETQGTYLERALGDDYRAVALIGEDVSINWPGVGTGPTQAPDADALETTLGALDQPVLLLDLHRQELFDGDAPTTMQGEVLRPLRHFDAVLFFREAAGMTFLN